MRTTLLTTALLAAFACTPALAQSTTGGSFLRDAGAASRVADDGRRDPALDDAAAAAASLAPGESRWLDDAPTGGAMLVVVDLSAQRATIFQGNHPVAVTTVSTGMQEHETPAGLYPILAKEKMHHSNIYDNAPMPFMQRLTWTGMALHAGRIPGYPASHGCVRLPKKFAEELYQVTTRGDMVVVADDASPASLMRAGLAPSLAMQVGAAGDDGGAMLAGGGAAAGQGAGAP